MARFRLATVAVAISVWTTSALGSTLAGHLVAPRPGLRRGPSPEQLVVFDRRGTQLPPLNQTYIFEQLIDHNDPSKGTFQQRYWHTWKDYKKGGPIILTTPGEENAKGNEDSLMNATINGRIAQQEGGATIVLEHRFFGESNPYPDLTVKSYQYHTIAQAIADLEYFAKNVNLPMPGGDEVTPDKAPWILIGGSYSGGLTAWTMNKTQDVFWAGYSSSGVVQAQVDFWQYFEPIREAMPKNCSADVQKVIAYVDEILTGSDTQAISDLKATFGLEDLVHNDDFANLLSLKFTKWQDMEPQFGPGSEFFEFCDALEVNDGKNAPEEGWGLRPALQAWGYFVNETYVVPCEDVDVETCIGSYDQNSTQYTNTTIDNWDRSWNWLTCNELGWFQTSAPQGQPTLVSRMLQPDHFQRRCQYMFPEAFEQPTPPRANDTNAEYHGWDIRVDRLFVANGKRDPWRDVTLSSEQHFVESTDAQPIALSDGFHCSDLDTPAADVDETIAEVQQQALSYMHQWLQDWRTGMNSKANSSDTTSSTGNHVPDSGALESDDQHANAKAAVSKLEIIGIVCGSVAGLAILAGIIGFFMSRRNQGGGILSGSKAYRALNDPVPEGQALIGVSNLHEPRYGASTGEKEDGSEEPYKDAEAGGTKPLLLPKKYKDPFHG